MLYGSQTKRFCLQFLLCLGILLTSGQGLSPSPYWYRVVIPIRGGSSKERKDAAAVTERETSVKMNNAAPPKVNVSIADNATATVTFPPRKRPWYSFRVTPVTELPVLEMATNLTTNTTTRENGDGTDMEDGTSFSSLKENVTTSAPDSGNKKPKQRSMFGFRRPSSRAVANKKEKENVRSTAITNETTTTESKDKTKKDENMTTKTMTTVTTTTTTSMSDTDNKGTASPKDGKIEIMEGNTTFPAPGTLKRSFFGFRRRRVVPMNEKEGQNATTGEDVSMSMNKNIEANVTVADHENNFDAGESLEEKSTLNLSVNDDATSAPATAPIKRQSFRMPRFQPKEWIQRLLHGDTAVLNSTNVASPHDTDGFVFSSKRGETVKKVHSTESSFESNSDKKTTRLGGRFFFWRNKQNKAKDLDASSVLGQPDASGVYSTWNPYESPTTDEKSKSINGTATTNNATTVDIERNITLSKNKEVVIDGGPTDGDQSTVDVNKTDASKVETNATASNIETTSNATSKNTTITNDNSSSAQNFTSNHASSPIPPGAAIPPGTTVLSPGNVPTYAAPPGNNQIVYMGGHPYRILRPGGRESPGSPTGRPSSNGMLFAEILAALLGTATRLWILTWLTRRLATQEETIEPIQRFVWERVNDRYERDVKALHSIISKPPTGVPVPIWKQQHVRKQTRYNPPRRNLKDTYDDTVIVLPVEVDKGGNFDVPYLTHVISFLIQQHRTHFFGTQPPSTPPLPWWKKLGRKPAEDDVVEEVLLPKPLEVVLLVKSPGGGVATYGLAAAQVKRLAQEPGILLTACVDHFAASGGYMIASQAHRLLAAPFATVGSIGVIMEGLNFHEIARKYGVQPIIIKAGANKNPLSTYGAVTPKEEKEEEARLAKVHDAFKQLVVEGRPVLADAIDQVGDGSVFLGQEALDWQLVDGIQTSEEYIMEKVQAGHRVLRLHRSIKPKFTRRIHLNPLDVLPHIRSWIVNSGLLDRLQDPGLLMTMSSAWEMGRYVLRQYMDSRRVGYE